MSSQTFPLIDCDVHIGPSDSSPLAPFIPAEFRQALEQGQGSRPSHGYVNPTSVIRRDIDLSNPLRAAQRHLDKYGIVYGVLQPPSMDAAVIHNYQIGLFDFIYGRNGQLAHQMGMEHVTKQVETYLNRFKPLLSGDLDSA